jgi:hypothetical protein
MSATARAEQAVLPTSECFQVIHTHILTLETERTRCLNCDEAKPGYLRCLHFEGHCDGYPTPRQKSTSSKFLPSPSKSVLPRKFINSGGKKKRYALAEYDGEKSFQGDDGLAIFWGRRGEDVICTLPASIQSLPF